MFEADKEVVITDANTELEQLKTGEDIIEVNLADE